MLDTPVRLHTSVRNSTNGCLKSVKETDVKMEYTILSVLASTQENMVAQMLDHGVYREDLQSVGELEVAVLVYTYQALQQRKLS